MSEVAELMTVTLQLAGRDIRKLSQVELLEAMVRHLRESRPQQLPLSQTAKFRVGYECCASEVSKFMAICGRPYIEPGINLLTHLAHKLNEIQPHREDPDFAVGSVQPPRVAPDYAFGSVQSTRVAPDFDFGSAQLPQVAPDFLFGSDRQSVIVHPPMEAHPTVSFHNCSLFNPTVLVYPSGSATSAYSSVTGIAPRFPMAGTSISTDGIRRSNSNSSDDVPQSQNSQRPW